MANQVPAPQDYPVPGNPVDPKSFDKVLERLRVPGLQAEFPLRKAFSNSTTTVLTNHFAIKLNPKLPLYEYEIKGFPDRMGKKTTRILIQEFVDKNEFLKNHKDKFITDYRATIVSWAELPEEALDPVPVASREDRQPIDLSLEKKGKLNTELLQQYAEGKAHPNKVRGVLEALVPHVTKANEASILLHVNLLT